MWGPARGRKALCLRRLCPAAAGEPGAGLQPWGPRATVLPAAPPGPSVSALSPLPTCAWHRAAPTHIQRAMLVSEVTPLRVPACGGMKGCHTHTSNAPSTARPWGRGRVQGVSRELGTAGRGWGAGGRTPTEARAPPLRSLAPVGVPAHPAPSQDQGLVVLLEPQGPAQFSTPSPVVCHKS